MKEGSEKFIVSVGFIRTIAIVGVISLHVTDALVNPTNYFGGVSWWLGNFINSLSRSAVPLFIMLSGFLILDPTKNYSFPKMVNKSFFRIAIPLVFWSIFYFLWRQRWWGELISPEYIIQSVFKGSLFHLYFLLIIIGLYLIAPLLRKNLNKAPLIDKKRFLILSFLFGFLITAASYTFPATGILINAFTLFSLYIGYFLAGDYLRNTRLSIRKAIFSISLILCLWLLTSFLNFWNRELLLQDIRFFWSEANGQYFGDYLSPNVILMSLLIFQLLINIDKFLAPLKEKAFFIIKHFSATAFGIYLIHPLIIDLLDHFANMAIHLITSNLWLYMIKKILYVFLISHFIVWILSRIPLVKRIFGEY
ncbi:MAG: acyltransferase family protein [Candidatus Curtissbacteria bacterium]|nr:acyltransferase family protein [Candidatus Curtissbacteria bacterium]